MRWKVTDEAGQRLDVAVVEKLPKLSRASASRLIDEGKVTIHGQPAKAGYKIRVGDEVVVDYDEKESEEHS